MSVLVVMMRLESRKTFTILQSFVLRHTHIHTHSFLVRFLSLCLSLLYDVQCLLFHLYRYLIDVTSTVQLYGCQLDGRSFFCVGLAYSSLCFTCFYLFLIFFDSCLSSICDNICMSFLWDVKIFDQQRFFLRNDHQKTMLLIIKLSDVIIPLHPVSRLLPRVNQSI